MISSRSYTPLREQQQQQHSSSQLVRVEILEVPKDTEKVYPKKGQRVAVHYTGFLADGTQFDSTKSRGKPLVFRMGAEQVIPGLDYGVSKISLGARAKLTISPEMAYGEHGFPGLIPSSSKLIFDITVVAVK
jgi:FK506-binding protein 1